MDYAFTKRLPCSVCGLDSIRRTGWFLVVENRWLDRLKILSWHSSLATRKDMQSVCCRQHLKTLIGHWLTQASLRLPPAQHRPLPIGSDSNLTDLDLGPQSLGRLLGELSVHRESFSRGWSGSPAALECILDALITIGDEDTPHAMELLPFDLPLESSHELTLQ
jgi:hypothetical protein